MLLLSLTAAAVGQAQPPPRAATRLPGAVVGCQGVLDTEVKAVPEAGTAVIYDRCAKRVRVLTADGRLTSLGPGGPGNILFDAFVWAASTSRLWWIGPAARFDPIARQFVRVVGPNDGARVATYVPRMGNLVIGATNGLFIAHDDRIEALRSTGARLGDVVRVTDLPRFGALLLELIDKSVLIRTANWHAHAIGTYDTRHETTQTVVELRHRPAVQLLASREAFDITMLRARDGVWRPGPVRHVALDSITQAWVNGYVPALDATLVRVRGWRLLDWWRDRSGLYTLGPSGLIPFGRYRDRPSENDVLNVVDLPGIGTTLLNLVRQRDRQPIAPLHYRVMSQGFAREPRLARVGRFPAIREMPGTGQTIITTPDALWRWDGRAAPVRLGGGRWPAPWALPLTREVALVRPGGLMLIDDAGRTSFVAAAVKPGRVIQLAPDRLFVINATVTEVRLSRAAPAR